MANWRWTKGKRYIRVRNINCLLRRISRVIGSMYISSRREAFTMPVIAPVTPAYAPLF